MHDYYRMVAIFNPLQRPQNGRTELDLPAGSRAEIAAVVERDRHIAMINKRIGELREAFRSQFLQSNQSKLPAELLDAFRTEPAKRNEEQRKLVDKHAKQLGEELAAAMPEETRASIAACEHEIGKVRATDKKKAPDRSEQRI